MSLCLSLTDDESDNSLSIFYCFSDESEDSVNYKRFLLTFVTLYYFYTYFTGDDDYDDSSYFFYYTFYFF